jgi:hypothetical protein
MHRALKSSVLVSLIVFVTLVIAGAQSSTGIVRGVVKDSSGAVLPGVTVSIAGRSAVTNAKGEFVVAGLAPGFHDVVAVLSGFTTIRVVVQVTADHVVNL